MCENCLNYLLICMPRVGHNRQNWSRSFRRIQVAQRPPFPTCLLLSPEWTFWLEEPKYAYLVNMSPRNVDRGYVHIHILLHTGTCACV